MTQEGSNLPLFPSYGLTPVADLVGQQSGLSQQLEKINDSTIIFSASLVAQRLKKKNPRAMQKNGLISGSGRSPGKGNGHRLH